MCAKIWRGALRKDLAKSWLCFRGILSCTRTKEQHDDYCTRIEQGMKKRVNERKKEETWDLLLMKNWGKLNQWLFRKVITIFSRQKAMTIQLFLSVSSSLYVKAKRILRHVQPSVSMRCPLHLTFDHVRVISTEEKQVRCSISFTSGCSSSPYEFHWSRCSLNPLCHAIDSDSC